jgi:hypothetical protein
MILLGLGGYFLGGRASMTALIPSFFGLAVALCGLAAPKLGRPALIIALVLSIVGALGSAGRGVPELLASGEKNMLAIGVQLAFAVVAVALAAVLVRGGALRK